ncbi:unannotated protein [freshwater metagenome]|uniref:Unannotated protein n=1 Tax=freshwater metagenome TaxID=449393 RepID=A0A6J7EKT5_9ZZZZ
MALGLAIASTASLAACSTSLSLSTQSRQPPQASQASSGAGAAVPSPAPVPIRTSPLTGLPELKARPVLVVKLDNTRNAQPHAGLTDADLVYIEEVEYGITRIAAVFSSTIPKRIGPVRSARITDIDLLAQYGSPAFAFSGAQHKLWPALAAAPFIDISPNHGAQSYARDFSRRAPYNYFLNGLMGLHRAPDATADHGMGFVFAEEPPAGGTPIARASMAWGYASAAFTYDPADGLFRVRLNGERARAEEHDRGQNASTVIIQYVRQRPSAYYDKGGGNTPHADTIGAGTALVLRDGQSWDVRWSRPDADSGTTFTMADGSPMPFKPGQQWIVLLDRERTVTIATPPANVTAPPSATPPTAAPLGSTPLPAPTASQSPTRG